MPIFRKHKQGTNWYLEGFVDEGKTWIVDLEPLPFVIGRQPGCHLRLASLDVSRRHALIYEQEGNLWIREFGSTNGTFVNRQRLAGETVLQSGDIVHFGSSEFRIINKLAKQSKEENSTRSIFNQELPYGFVNCEAEFIEMLKQRALVPYFQPIIRLSDRQTVAFELLGRGNFEDLPTSPWPLMQIARRLNKEVELSELFRWIGVQKACQFGIACQLFVNTAPAEMDVEHLQLSLQKLREQIPSLPLVLEVHETAVTDIDLMKSLRSLLTELNIKLAYDDFGAGRARLVELMQVPPDYLKFDIVLIHNIHTQPLSGQRVLQNLVHMAQDLEIQTLAEGIEVQEELDACIDIGFELAQGYYLGRPAPSLTAFTS